MGDKQLAAFESTVAKTNSVLKEIERSRGWTAGSRRRSYAALRAVLHALRDRLTVSEAAHLAAQLPMLVRGVFYEGWDPSRAPVKMRRAEFLDRVRRELPATDDLTDLADEHVERVVVAVLTALRRYITDGEWHDIRSTMPRELAAIMP